MARFDVFEAAAGESGYLLDVQSEWLGGLNTRVVVPLWPPAAAPSPARDLNPTFEVLGAPHVMVTQFLGAVRAATLRRRVGTLNGEHLTILRALDTLLSGP